jgi:Spy/CpxP family protein refolding chaperone
MKRLLLALSVLAICPEVLAEQHMHDHAQPPSAYAGEESRQIKSLSADDITELRRGGGWGLAKAAELNGMPGPAHLLELKYEIPLTFDQVSKIEAAFMGMKEKAVAEGERLIARERELEEAFRSGTVTDASLKEMISSIEESRAALRYIHLSAHLATPHLLTPQQVAKYVELRGYAKEPCNFVPEGHDAAMWRLHNSCK